jgi:hypothetical protein
MAHDGWWMAQIWVVRVFGVPFQAAPLEAFTLLKWSRWEMVP